MVIPYGLFILTKETGEIVTYDRIPDKRHLYFSSELLITIVVSTRSQKAIVLMTNYVY